MDFFTSQDKARRNTKWLVLYFICAVLGIIAALYFVVWGVFMYAAESHRKPHLLEPQLLVLVVPITLLIIGLGSLYKTWELRRGGEYVAQMLGGRRLQPNATSLAERRLLNIVEEMALASGIPAPPVYVLDREGTINAFAAGFTPADAVIGVNQGTLEYLSRDELQGVIAHEFSHILNGDMRMNLRLIGILHGILLISIIGYYLMRIRSSNSNGKGGGGIALVGLAAYLLGLLGLFFGRMIKAGISRQREYLADASAVQFTRNPPGIAGALKKIGGLSDGSRIKHPEAETASHMFFSSAMGNFMSGMLSTHPPLAERIRRIDPEFTGKFSKTQPAPIDEEEGIPISRAAAAQVPVAPRAAKAIHLVPQQAIEMVGSLTPAKLGVAADIVAQLVPTLRAAIREPFSARCVVFTMLLDPDLHIRKRQIEIVSEREGSSTASETERLQPILEQAAVQVRLPLLEIVQGTLRSLSGAQYKRFRGTVQALVAADEKTSMFEFVLQRMLLSQLDRHFQLAPPPSTKFHTLSHTVAHAASDLLSVIAYAGSRSPSQAAVAYRAGAQTLHGARDDLLPCDHCTIKVVDQALSLLMTCAPRLKKQILNALLATAASDQQVTIEEAELLRAFTDAMDCPMPPW